jgi:endonuclease III
MRLNIRQRLSDCLCGKIKLEPFDIARFIRSLKHFCKQLDAPIITFIANRGATPFEILVSTLLSLRTKDEVTAVAASKLLKLANTPADILKLGEERIKELIYPVGFYPTKAKRLIQISTLVIEKYGGLVPDMIDELLKLPGVGRKTANLVLTEGFKKQAICVDTHVHRISNRIGYVRTRTPEQTEFALREKLPGKYWIKYNEFLVAFGQTICRPVSPFCTKCPVESMCVKVGVTRSR